MRYRCIEQNLVQESDGVTRINAFVRVGETVEAGDIDLMARKPGCFVPDDGAPAPAPPRNESSGLVEPADHRYERMLRAELLGLAADAGITGASRMSKDQIAEALRAKDQ